MVGLVGWVGRWRRAVDTTGVTAVSAAVAGPSVVSVEDATPSDP